MAVEGVCVCVFLDYVTNLKTREICDVPHSGGLAVDGKTHNEGHKRFPHDTSSSYKDRFHVWSDLLTSLFSLVPSELRPCS
jgi:hypothetical protein